EIERICKVQDQLFLHAENYIAGQLENFKIFVEYNNYQNLSKIYTEQTIKDVLQMLIRRYHLIQYMESHKRDWNNWLDKEKKSTKYGYQKAQVWA
ncbi:MAG TPA: hypothetical protein VFQ36_11445, partial [Ktedonobacteraceae bacterium]|nr:hypothetical protein [Ktedonobacteraceae bacterium]